MTLIIEGPTYIDNLENSLVLSQFLRVPNKKISTKSSIFSNKKIPFQHKNLGKFIKF